MRLTLFRGRDYAQAPTGDLTGPDRGEAGADGELWLRDMLQGGPDSNPELSGRRKFLVYDEMRRTDATVKSLLMFYKLTVRSAAWSLDPRTDNDPVDLLIRDMVAANLGLEGQDGWLDLSWGKTVDQGLGMIDMGCSFEELVWGDVRSWRDADGDEHLVRPLARLAPRQPASVEKIEWNSNGSIRKLHQSIAGTKPIPGDKLVYHVYEPSTSWDGVSILRPAWGAWTLKKLLIVSTGIGWDRYSSGTPVVWHPDTPEGEQMAKTIGRNVRTHQRAYVHLPVPQGGTKDDSEWALEILNAASSIADPEKLLQWCSNQIAEAGLQHFTRQGLGQTGARATAETQADPFYLAAGALAEDLARERARQVIRKLVAVNFGEDAAEYRTPRLTVSKIRARNIETISKAIAMLEPAGFTFADRGTQDDVRDLLGFTQLPEELEEHGISRASLLAALKSAGLDQEQLAAAVAALPADVGVKRNTVPKEGAGLGL